MPVERTIGRPALSPPEPMPSGAEPRRRLPSIRGRLRRLVILSVGIALACSALLSVWQATRTYLVDKRETLLATANVIAGSSSRAVAAGYAVLLRDSLRPVARLPGVSYARIEGADGRVLGETGGTVRLSSEMALDQTESDSVYAFLRTRTVQVSVPIIYAGATVGRVILVSKTGDLAARFLGVFVIASLGAAIATGIGLLIAYRLQRSITSPLATLATEMARIARTQDYDASVPPTSDLETEQLAGSFKQMIGEIQNPLPLSWTARRS
jgi:methyl-accepting chemotaxis protein